MRTQAPDARRQYGSQALQAEFDEQERIEREKAEKEEEVNVALTKEWNDIQEKIEADQLLAERLQAREQEEYFDTILMQVIPDEEEVAIDAIPLNELLKTTPHIVELGRIHKEGKNSYNQIINTDGIQRYLKTMFDPHVEDQVWKNQHDYKVLDWKLYDSCGVHSLRLQHVYIHMLVEKRYPLTPATITDMLNKKLQADHWNEICYQLLKLSTASVT
ncbi:hypothetical protein Tco_1244954 [Tanacetum coccineum]